MTVNEFLIKVMVAEVEDRRDKLVELGAPSVVVESCTKRILSVKENPAKFISGLSRKWKIGKEDITEYPTYCDTIGYYYKEGKKPTRVYRIITESGKYYLDMFGAKIDRVSDNGVTSLDVRVSDKDFR